jgi:hypothetical protein
MASVTYIAKVTLYAGRIVQAGEEYELELPEGQLPPPEDVAVPKKSKAGKAALAELSGNEEA